MRPRLTVDDIDQIVEGISEFIISGNPRVEEVWQPYLDKLAVLREDLSTGRFETATWCEGGT